MKPSIIVICHNEEKYIRSCIQSILDQSYKDFQLVIVDDGSTDSTGKIIRSFSDNRIDVVRYGKRKGYATARNSGLGLADGEIVFFTDADCVVDKDWVKAGLKHFSSHPDVLGIRGVGSKRSQLKKGSAMERSAWRRAALMDTISYPGTWNCAYRKVEELRFDPRYDMGGEDAELGIRMGLKGRLGICRDMKAVHRFKPMTFRGSLEIVRRKAFNVNIIKDFGAHIPKLRRSRVCRGNVMFPGDLLAMLFPPYVIVLLGRKGRKLRSIADVLFLVPFYFSLWYSRAMIWRQSARERVFLF